MHACPLSQTRWIEEYNNAINIDWAFSYALPFKCRLNARVKYFQYQVVHRTLITNKKLYQFNLLDHNTCDNCNEIETIRHLLFECNSVKKLWRDIGKWIKDRIKSKINTDTFFILLGHPKHKYLVNYIIIVVKHEIFKGKWNNHIPNLNEIKKVLKNYMKLEIFIGSTTNGLEKVMGKWSSIYNDLMNV